VAEVPSRWRTMYRRAKARSAARGRSRSCSRGRWVPVDRADREAVASTGKHDPAPEVGECRAFTPETDAIKLVEAARSAEQSDCATVSPPACSIEQPWATKQHPNVAAVAGINSRPAAEAHDGRSLNACGEGKEILQEQLDDTAQVGCSTSDACRGAEHMRPLVAMPALAEALVSAPAEPLSGHELGQPNSLGSAVVAVQFRSAAREASGDDVPGCPVAAGHLPARRAAGASSRGAVSAQASRVECARPWAMSRLPGPETSLTPTCLPDRIQKAFDRVWDAVASTSDGPLEPRDFRSTSAPVRRHTTNMGKETCVQDGLM